MPLGRGNDGRQGVIRCALTGKTYPCEAGWDPYGPPAQQGDERRGWLNTRS